MTDDAALLRQYCATRSEAAFRALVDRHLGLVYGSAVRQLQGDAHLARDVCQMVFVALAARASGLGDHPSVAGWLYVATHHKVTEVTRAERRRRARERAATEMNAMAGQSSSVEGNPAGLRGLIDEALLKLGRRDREAILLRFFEGRSYGEMGAREAISEKGAHKRVERALVRLRRILARRGVTSSAEALTVLLASEAAASCPPGLAAEVTGAAVAGGLSTGGFGVLSALGASKATMAVAALAGLLAVALSWRDWGESGRLSEALAHSQSASARLAGQVQQLGVMNSALSGNLRPDRFLVPESFDNGAAGTLSSHASLGADGRRKASLSAADLSRNGAVHEMLGELVEWDDEHYWDPLLSKAGLSPAERARAEYLIGQVVRFGSFSPDGGTLSFKTDSQPSSQIESEIAQILGPAGLAQANTFLVQRDVVDQLAGNLYDSDSPLTRQQADQLAQVVVAAALPQRPHGLWLTPGFVDWSAVANEAAGFLSPPQIARLNAMAAETLEEEK